MDCDIGGGISTSDVSAADRPARRLAFDARRADRELLRVAAWCPPLATQRHDLLAGDDRPGDVSLARVVSEAVVVAAVEIGALWTLDRRDEWCGQGALPIARCTLMISA